MRSDLPEFIDCLSTQNHLDLTDNDIQFVRWFVKSDGCTKVPDYFLPECIKHDFYYRTHIGFDGKVLTRAEADKRFRLGMQKRSVLGILSPVSWIRWAGVRLFAQAAWDRHEPFRV